MIIGILLSVCIVLLGIIAIILIVLVEKIDESKQLANRVYEMLQVKL